MTKLEDGGGSARQRFGGFAAVLQRGAREVERRSLLPDVAKLLSHYIGPYSEKAYVGEQGTLGWGLLVPDSSLPLTSWSVFRSPKVMCLLEGEFYDGAFGCSAKSGWMESLAERFVNGYETSGPAAVNELNGSFCGVIIWPEEDRAALVVDRFSTRSIYWHLGTDRFIVATNLGAFRGANRADRRMDPLTMLDLLTTDVIVDDRTLLGEVRAVPGAHVARYERDNVTYERYWYWPKRSRNLSLERSAVRINDAMESHVRRVCDRLEKPVVQALSGGHDSRVILAALRQNQVPAKACCFARQEQPERDVLHARMLAETAGIPFHLINHDFNDNINLIPDCIVLSGGSTSSFGYLRLGTLCAVHGKAAFVGFNGDTLSGDYSGFNPWRCKTMDEMTCVSLKKILKGNCPRVANRFLPTPLKNPNRVVADRWRASFPSGPAEEVIDRFLFQRLLTVNRRPMLDQIDLMRTFVTPIYPFLDTEVLEAYLRLPTAHMVARSAHALAGYRQFPEMGKIPPSARYLPMNLDWQTSRMVVPIMQVMSGFARSLKGVRSWVPSMRRKSIPSPRTASPYTPLMEKAMWGCDLYDSAIVRSVLERFRTNTLPTSVRLLKLAQFALFHAIYVTNRGTDLPLRFSDPKPRSFQVEPWDGPPRNREGSGGW